MLYSNLVEIVVHYNSGPHSSDLTLSLEKHIDQLIIRRICGSI